MIEKVIITDRKNLWLSYMSEVLHEAEYIFTPGVNIIVGENGCGKSTLFKAIYDYMLANNGIYSSVPDRRLLFPRAKLLDDQVPNGMKVKADYKSRLYRLISFQDICAKQERLFDHDANLEMFANLQHTSKGEESHHGFYKMMDIMFRVGREYDLPFVQLVDDNGNMSKETREYAGKFVKEADKFIIDDFTSAYWDETIKPLKKGKTYYIRVRSVAKGIWGGKTIRSNWSKTVKVKAG